VNRPGERVVRVALVDVEVAPKSRMTGVDNSRSLIDAGDLVLLSERPPHLVAAREERDVLDNVARLCQIDHIASARVRVGRRLDAMEVLGLRDGMAVPPGAATAEPTEINAPTTTASTVAKTALGIRPSFLG
jgi:hypothetical protein